MTVSRQQQHVQHHHINHQNNFNDIEKLSAGLVDHHHHHTCSIVRKVSQEKKNCASLGSIFHQQQSPLSVVRDLYGTLLDSEDKKQEEGRKEITLSLSAIIGISNVIESDSENESDNENDDGSSEEQEQDCNSNDSGCSWYDTNEDEYEEDEYEEDEYDIEEEEEEFTIVPIHDNFVNKRQMLSKESSVAAKRRNELLLDDASDIFDSIRAMDISFNTKEEPLLLELLSSGDEEDDDDECFDYDYSDDYYDDL